MSLGGANKQKGPVQLHRAFSYGFPDWHPVVQSAESITPDDTSALCQPPQQPGGHAEFRPRVTRKEPGLEMRIYAPTYGPSGFVPRRDMGRVNGKFTRQRLLSAPCGHERYRLELQGELHLSFLPGRVLRVRLVTEEVAENRQHSHLQLGIDVAGVAVEEMHQLPPGPGDCWSIAEQLCPAPTVELFALVLAPLLQRVEGRNVASACAAKSDVSWRPRSRRVKKNPAAGGVREIRFAL